MSQEDIMRPKVVFVLGAPGSGKGTQSANIAREYGFVHISIDDLLSQEIETEGSYYGPMIEYHLVNGIPIPAEVFYHLIDAAMKNYRTNRFVIDDFFRSKDHLEIWKQEMEVKVDLLFLIHLDCTDSVCFRRCLGRIEEGNVPPVGFEEAVKKKIIRFYRETYPIINYFKVIGFVKTIDSNKPIEDVFNDIRAIFERI